MKSSSLTVRTTAKAVIFLVLGIYLWVHITYVFRPETMENLNFKGFYAEEYDSLDVVFIGSSGLRASIDPMRIYNRTGIKSFVLATSQQNPLALTYLINEAKLRQPNALFVVDLGGCKYSEETWDSANEGSIRHVTDGLQYSINYFTCVYDMVKKRTNKLLYYFDLLYYHDNWENDILVRELKNPSWNYKKVDEKKGHALWTELKYQERIWDEESTKPRNYEWDTERINKTISYCEKSDLKVVFMVSNENLTNYSDYIFLSEVVGDRYPLVYMNSYCDEINLDYLNDFYDVGHLNLNGSLKASDKMADILLNYISEIKSDKSGHWDIQYQEYLRDVEEGQTKLEEYKANYINYNLKSDYENNKICFWITTQNTFDTEYAWYVEHIDNENTIVDKMDWYSKEPVHVFDTCELKDGVNYQIRFFIRDVENTNKKEDKIVAYLNWNSDTGIWEYISNFYY